MEGKKWMKPCECDKVHDLACYHTVCNWYDTAPLVDFDHHHSRLWLEFLLDLSLKIRQEAISQQGYKQENQSNKFHFPLITGFSLGIEHFKHYNSDGYNEGGDKFISCKFKIFIFDARTEHADQDNNQNITRLEHDDNWIAYKNDGHVVGDRRDENYWGADDTVGFGDLCDDVRLEEEFVVDAAE